MGTGSVDTAYLRPALEFAVRFAAEGQKSKPALSFPAGLKRYLRADRLSAGVLPAVRRVVDGDDGFRARLADAATADLVGPVGMIWLARGEGWEEQLVDAVADVERERHEADTRRELIRSEKRREAAERAAARALADLTVVRDQVISLELGSADLQVEIERLAGETGSLRSELIAVRTEVRHARDREQAALRRAETAENAYDQISEERDRAVSVRDAAISDRVDVATDRAELARLAASAEALAARLSALGAAGDPARREPRRALPMPGGVLGSSRAATEYLLGSGATMLVDGYNAAKLGWPDVELADQRRLLLNHLENVCRRFGTDVTVVFDGSEVVGAHSAARRLVRVMYSAPGEIADDLIRSEVDRLPNSRPVVVATNDKAILRDVKAKGANILSSNQLLAVS